MALDRFFLHPPVGAVIMRVCLLVGWFPTSLERERQIGDPASLAVMIRLISHGFSYIRHVAKLHVWINLLC